MKGLLRGEPMDCECVEVVPVLYEVPAGAEVPVLKDAPVPADAPVL